MIRNVNEPKIHCSLEREKLLDMLKCLILDESTLDRVTMAFESEMNLALNMKSSSLQMENTYIPELPDGTEEGSFLAIDLGGTHFRVIFLVFEDGGVTHEIVEYYNISSELRLGSGTALFDFMAECIHSFALKNNLRDDITYALGFTFSFPMRQNGLDSGILLTWTKSFSCPSVVGEDVVEMLRQSLAKCNRKNIEILAILNDTTGTLMHGALMDRRSRIGVVLGTGTNGCYLESADRVKNWQQQRHNEHHVIIDVEWGAFGDNGVLEFIKTDYDRIVDNSSLLTNSFTFEKYIGGKYLGELCRVVMYKLYENRLLLKNVPIQNFPAPWTFDSHFVSKIETDSMIESTDYTRMIVETIFKCNDYNSEDLEIMRYVCGLISRRAAQLIAITISSLMNRMETDSDITIAIDGSVYKHHPRLRQWIFDYVTQWAPTKKSNFLLVENGSGKGAALVAAIAAKLRKRNQS